MKASFRSELSAITLDEGSNTSWVQALKTGSFKHPFFGDIQIDPARAQRFVANETARVRGIQLDVDYDHKAQRMDAAGWVQTAEARPDGVWYLVEWTEEAANKIRNKQYKYFSAEFADKWTHPETGTEYQDVLFGGALTNRPFIKGMVPVNLSESEAEQARLTEEVPTSTGGGGATEGAPVDLTALRTKLKLSEGTSDEDVIAAALALADPAPAPVVEPPADDLTKLAESHPALAKILADNAEQQKRLADMETLMRLQEVRTALSEVDADTTTVITPAVKQLAEPLLAKLPAKERADLVGILRQFAEGKGTVVLGEPAGTAAAGARAAIDGGDPVKKFTDLVSEIEAKDKVPYKEAFSRATLHENGTLYQQYREATTAFKVVTS